MVASLLLISSAHSELQFLNSVGVGRENSLLTSNICGNDISNVNSLSNKQVYETMQAILNDKDKVFFRFCDSIRFKNVYDATITSELLRRIINDPKNKEITTDDVKVFNNIMNKLSTEDKEIASFLMFQIISLFRAKGDALLSPFFLYLVWINCG